MFPFPIKPMLLQAREKPYDSPDHIFEWKIDGHRCVMHFQKDHIRLQSKTGKDCTRQYPELRSPLLHAQETILDGEVTVLTKGKPDLETTMERYLASSKNIPTLSRINPAAYIVWDLLWLDGKPTISLPLMERKELLAMTLEDSDYVRKIDYIETDGLAMWDAVKSLELEGMVAKGRNTVYKFGGRGPWEKIKKWEHATVNVLGYNQKEGTALVGFGTIVQGRALGINKTDRAVLWRLLDQYGNFKGNIIWLPAGVKAKVKFTTLTPRGNMRDCTWVGFEV